MSDLKQNNQNDFITEKIKVRPVNKKKLIRRTIITISMAIIFGLVACVTFLVLEPVISNWLYPKKEPETQTVRFPEDKEEMSPEEMLAENLPTESPEPTPEPTPTPEPVQDPEEGKVVLGEEQVQEILSQVTLDLKHYKEMYAALSVYAEELSCYIVTVTAVTSNIDWLNDVQESRNQCSGVIVSENGLELLILTDYSNIMSGAKLLVTFYDDSQVEAQLKQYNSDTNLAVLSVALDALSEEMKSEEQLPIAQFGYSGARNLVGTPVVAVGSPMGTSNSVGYGIVTSSNTTLSMSDRNYKLIQTDISGSQNASGVLFDLQGQVIGIITNNKAASGMKNLITVYGITELQKIVEKMSNASPVAYMGIRGVDVPKEASEELGIPLGAYVEEVEMESPAMRAGIQRGDVIVSVDDKTVSGFNSYSNTLLLMEPEQTVKVTVMRQAQEEYKEMEFSIELGGVE
ncbi:S1C family serine protease [Acetatifactor muris]|nr:trypsin-like peptidase domain-containing protein [Acetatifactor muris]MCI8798990.1 PDZ domain-containing protein [Lachnospiraceae bacterium]MCR2049677.1 S1C family serine protease [Acetatifactor muris]